jgi:KaiC/GvpD/RAD55 family RecA-like ATPase
MSSYITIPTGIEGLDKIITGFPRGGLITVSGNPGTGKTALAGAFIYNSAVKFNEPGVYASFLEDEERFYDFMSGFGLDFRSLRDKGLFKYLAIPTLFEPGMSISVADILETVESIGAKRLVIDSFTALSQMFKSPPEARVFLHSLLSKIARQMDCTTMLIKEVQSEQVYEYGFEEFISDGVILLRREIMEDRVFREVRILKMRGSQIKEPLSCISLYKGFRIYDPVTITQKYYDDNRRYEPPPDPPSGYTTGISDLDKEMGGFPTSSTIVYEIDPTLTMSEYNVLVTPFAASYISRDRPEIVLPTGGFDWKDILKYVMAYGISPDKISNYMRILVDVVRTEDILPKNVKKIDMFSPADVINEIGNLTDYFLKSRSCSPLVILGMDRLVFRLREAAFDVTYYLSNMVREIGGLTLWIIKPVYPWIIERLAPVTHIHLRIAKHHGRIILKGIKPRLPFYIVDLVKDDLEPRLIPIV